MIQFVIVDLDGPILDGKFRHYACYSQILMQRGYTPISLENYWQMKREQVNRREQLAASGSESMYEEFLQAWLKLIEQPQFLALDRPQPGMIDKLQQWRNSGLQLILVTLRRSPERLHAQLVELGLDSLLDYVLPCAHQLGANGKVEQVKKAVSQVSPENSIWIGDTEVDVEAARLLGCPIWAVTCGLRTELYLASLSPDFLSPDLSSINLRCLDGN
ncbi:HAD hydrolase-like protein [Lyngbya sp. CCAP 1446/10]|uniref:HAD family hydrolase n=1 Tax=Lyngbya sp. CCAP 1446/10 TaxID=439293 RepID=UPI002238F932|nr:HAD hydrolase-like protein [Lyngbya sp. CCAP 1446/10]MCW6050395.1 HAD hydrolase-like protein [Lyngbya sp. CCAP 1446/10]